LFTGNWKIVAWLLFSLILAGAQPALCQLMQASQPRLVLVLVVDQFSYDYMNRFGDKFGPNGFRYLQNHGAVFTNCRYKQATTQTAVGHSIIATGAYPWSTGIIANDWFDRRKDKEIIAVTDESLKLVGANGIGASARTMIGTTLGDSLKMATNGRSKVFSLSLKDRGALFLAGKLANSACWFDTQSGSFVSSSQFGESLPPWVSTSTNSAMRTNILVRRGADCCPRPSMVHRRRMTIHLKALCPEMDVNSHTSSQAVHPHQMPPFMALSLSHRLLIKC